MNVVFVKDHINECYYGLYFVLIAYLLFKSWRWRPASFPTGPVGLPFFGYSLFLGKYPFETLRQLQKKYGVVIGLRLGLNYTIIISDYTILKEVFNHPATLGVPSELFTNLGEIGFSNKSGEEWQEQRKFTMQIAKRVGMSSAHWNYLMQEELEHTTRKLESYNGEPADAFKVIFNTVTSVLTVLITGRRVDLEMQPEVSQILKDTAQMAVETSSPINIALFFPGLLRLLLFLNIGIFRRIKEVIGRFEKFIKTEITGHESIKDDENKDDFISSYMEEMRNKKITGSKSYFTDKNLMGNVKLLYLASVDTTTISLNWLFRLIAAHQRVQEKVYEELSSVLGGNGAISYDDRHRAPYTFATILESQRFATIVRLSTPRSISTTFSVKGYTFPKGCQIIPNLWAINQDSKYWKNPEEYIPERFLTPDGTVMQNPPSFAPFSYGKRSCPGEVIANSTLFIIYATLLMKFKIALPEGVKPNFEVIVGLSANLKPQPLCFIRRK